MGLVLGGALLLLGEGGDGERPADHLLARQRIARRTLEYEPVHGEEHRPLSRQEGEPIPPYPPPARLLPGTVYLQT